MGKLSHMKGVVDRWLEARSTRDLGALAQLTSLDAKWTSPVEGTVRGRVAVVEQVKAGYTETDDFFTETLASETRGDKSVAHVRNRGRRNGKQLDSHQWLIIRTRDGLVADVDIRVDDPGEVQRFWND